MPKAKDKTDRSPPDEDDSDKLISASASAKRPEQGDEDEDDSDQWSDVISEEEEEKAPKVTSSDDDVGTLKIDIDKGKKRRKKRRNSADEDIPEEVANSLDSEDYKQVEKVAKKLNLSRSQVKVIMRRLLESPDFVNMVLEKPIDSKLEPKFTRTQVKAVKEKGEKLPWILEKLEKTPVKDAAVAELLPVDKLLPEEEEGDDDYDPNKDPDAIPGSEDEENSSVGGSQTPQSIGQLVSPSSSSISTPKQLDEVS